MVEEEKKTASKEVSRREFLIIMGAVGVATVAGTDLIFGLKKLSPEELAQQGALAQQKKEFQIARTSGKTIVRDLIQTKSDPDFWKDLEYETGSMDLRDKASNPFFRNIVVNKGFDSFEYHDIYRSYDEGKMRALETVPLKFQEDLTRQLRISFGLDQSGNIRLNVSQPQASAEMAQGAINKFFKVPEEMKEMAWVKSGSGKLMRFYPSVDEYLSSENSYFACYKEEIDVDGTVSLTRMTSR